MERPENTQNKWRMPRELIGSNTIDISDHVHFYFYEACWYWDLVSGIDKREKLGRIGGIANTVGQAMCFLVTHEKIA